MLTKGQLEQYKTEGYTVIPQYASAEQIAQLRGEAKEILDAFEMQTTTIFTTDNQTDFVDQYFLESGDKIRCFFEEGAFDKTGELQAEKHLAINKIGHAMHDLNPIFQKFSYQQKLLQAALSVGFTDPIMMQSMYIFKQPRIGAAVNPHQDSTFLYTKPHTCAGFWVALEDSTIENGCLWGIPGSHLQYKNKRRYIRKEGAYQTEFIGDWEKWSEDDLIPLEVKSGDMIIFDGNFVHASKENQSEKSRHAYVMHLIDGSADYPSDNWLQRSADFPFRKLKAVIG